MMMGRKRNLVPSRVASISFGELDNQNRILGSQTQGSQKADLEINIVVQPPQARGDNAADSPEGESHKN
jgi:hypothetical protein